MGILAADAAVGVQLDDLVRHGEEGGGCLERLALESEVESSDVDIVSAAHECGDHGFDAIARRELHLIDPDDGSNVIVPVLCMHEFEQVGEGCEGECLELRAGARASEGARARVALWLEEQVVAFCVLQAAQATKQFVAFTREHGAHDECERPVLMSHGSLRGAW